MGRIPSSLSSSPIFAQVKGGLAGGVNQGCSCEACMPQGNGFDVPMRMICCSLCGNKRCPHATNHANLCTNSNEVGQPGSSWEHVVPFGGGELADAPVAVPVPEATVEDAPLNPWHQAMLDECMAIEGAYQANDPKGTLQRLINWHVMNERHWPHGLEVDSFAAAQGVDSIVEEVFLNDAWQRLSPKETQELRGKGFQVRCVPEF